MQMWMWFSTLALVIWLWWLLETILYLLTLLLSTEKENGRANQKKFSQSTITSTTLRPCQEEWCRKMNRTKYRWQLILCISSVYKPQPIKDIWRLTLRAAENNRLFHRSHEERDTDRIMYYYSSTVGLGGLNRLLTFPIHDGTPSNVNIVLALHVRGAHHR